MPRISFRLFIVLFVLAAAGIAAGVALYWQRVGAVLERDMTAHVSAASEEAATDFNRLLDSDKRTLESVSLTVEDMYPWGDPQKLQDFLSRQTHHNSFKLLGVLTQEGAVYLSAPRTFDRTFLSGILAHTLEQGHYLSNVQTDPLDGKDVLIQSVSLRRNGRPVGALFALQTPSRYRPLLALSALGNEGQSLVIQRSGVPVLGYQTPLFSNFFNLLKPAVFDGQMTLAQLKEDLKLGKHSLTGYRLNKKHYFLHYVPLEKNDWYMLSVLPTEIVEQQAQKLTGMTLVLVFGILGIFCGLLFYIFYLRNYSNRQLFKSAFVDQLTGADNFNRMCEIFPEKLAAIDGKSALLISDINKFKVINDLHGYERGNQVLKRVAQILREEMQEGECFCRSAADNFILLLKYEDLPNFRKRLNNLATKIRRDCTVADSCLMIDTAFGVYEIKEEIPFYIMLDRAHLALENAKKMSVNKCQFYDESDRQRIVAERQIENLMEAALENEDFAVYFQPKCDFTTGQMKGAEALVRWRKGDENLIRPDDFIPIFEKNGFILRLDMFILEQVVKMLAAWTDNGLRPVPIAVNFSRLHLNDSRYIAQMRRLVGKHGVPRELIEVELTESIIFNNLERAQSVINELHQEGFSVAMDDFGSGYSSLNVLKDLRFDSIKLDREFLRGFEKNDSARQVILGAVSMIKSLGIHAVAEGVETREQADFLREAGCDLAQGYFFSKPLPPAEFEAFLLETNQKY